MLKHKPANDFQHVLFAVTTHSVLLSKPVKASFFGGFTFCQFL